MAGIERHRVPAIVLGRGPTALGMLRCLRMAGIPCTVAAPTGDHVAHSRWFLPTPGPKPWQGQLGEEGWSALRQIPTDKAVIIPGADDAALWLTALPDDLAARFPTSNSSAATQALLQDKSRFAALASELAVPHPRTYRIDVEADLDQVPFDQLDRVFVKPVNSQAFSDMTGAKGFWVATRAELRDTWRRFDGMGFRVMVQEYVPGPPDAHVFVDGFRDAQGNITALFARRRVRISPPDFGNSSYCHSIALGDIPDAVDDVKRLLAHVHYRGIFSAEFKHDPRDGVHRILEVNTRAWTYVEFAARCGVNVCAMAYADALGLPVSAASSAYPLGKGCVDLYRDLGTVWAQRGQGRWPWHTVLAQWAGAYYHSFRLDDPGPALHFVGELAARTVGRMHAAVPRQAGSRA
jgi:predicted ATP-grasp superfamily ATP-dependent carboligase